MAQALKNYIPVSYSLNPHTQFLINYCLKYSHEARTKGTMKIITIVVIKSTVQTSSINTGPVSLP